VEGRFSIIVLVQTFMKKRATHQRNQRRRSYLKKSGNDNTFQKRRVAEKMDSIGTSLGLIRGGVFIKSSRLVQLIAGLAERIKNKGEIRSWRGLEIDPNSVKIRQFLNRLAAAQK
jgi:hypothetical protein